MTTPALSVRFGNCEFGWIGMWVTVGTEPERRFSFSHYCDSSSELLAWLEAIAIGSDHCIFQLDEESSEAMFKFHREYRRTWFYVHGGPERELAAEVSRRELVSTFYKAFVSFAGSPAYRPEHWEHATLRDIIERENKIPFARWAADVMNRDSRGLQMAIWQFARDIANDRSMFAKENIGSATELLALCGQTVTEAGGLPLYWDIDWRWPGWDSDRRLEYLDELGAEIESDWSGLPWPRLRSWLVEKWLNQPETAETDKWRRWLIPYLYSTRSPAKPGPEINPAYRNEAPSGMAHKDFHVGDEFWTETGRWRCTDVGSRTICAIKVDELAPDWFNGPPYVVVESVFDEHDFGEFYSADDVKGRAQNPSATLSGENVAWGRTTSS